MSRVWCELALVFPAALACAAQLAAEEPPRDAAGIELFEKRIRPLFAENCHQCHGAKKQESGLALVSPAALRKGGDRGPPIVPGEPDRSLLIRAVGYADDDLKMPPRGKLKDEQVADLVAWVKLGAPLPPENVASLSPANPDSEFNFDERRKHWAYQPVVARPLPPVTQPAWCATPVDRYILARLDAAGLSPAQPADRRKLLRRLTYDLTGLPPTPDEFASFLADASPDAYERLVDRVLASPRYGERWARHWLDVVRYCETLGFEFDYDLHNAWRYRDYVIRAFNGDLPYDRFVVEHLAGDLVPDPRRHRSDGTNESILATGFFWMLEGKQTPVDIRQDQADRIDNQIDVLGKAFLGQTIACARCHDHKFDAISTRDYYSLAGHLRSSRYQQAFIDAPNIMRAKRQELAALGERVQQPLRVHLAKVWEAQLATADRYMLAAQRVKFEAGQPSGAEQIASELRLDSDQLKRWAKALQHESLAAADHPLHAWRQLASPVEAVKADSGASVSSESPVSAVGKSADAAKATHFAEFRGPDFGDWFVTGDAFGQSPAAVGQLVIGGAPERPVARVSFGGADSGQLTDRLQGELRSPTFTIDSRFVHLKLAGQNARVNLVIDGYTLIMNPMYGKLTAAPGSNVASWRTMPVDRWLGHRAYLEVSDSTIPLFGLNPPPSTARTPDGPDGHIVLFDVVFSDDPEPPARPNSISMAAAAMSLDGTPGKPLESLAAAYQALMRQQIERFRDNKLAAEHESESGLINWLLENGLLDGALREMGLAPSLADSLQTYHQLVAALPMPQRALAIADGTGEDEFVFLRGNYRTPGERAARGPPEVLNVAFPADTAADNDSSIANVNRNTGSGRLELAMRLADASNPLLTRTIVNRLWQHHFGAGVVRTPDDFGRMAQPPTHPELLDYLAAELVHSAWSLKSIHRRIVTSATYRQSSSMRNSESEIQNLSADPDNRLLYRFPVRRLEAEAIRDSILAISGRLSGVMHGPSVLPYLTPHMEGRGKPNSGPLDGEGRRSIYINARRNFLTPFLLAFDYPVTFTPIGRRGSSAIPAQSLALMNEPFVVQEAARWAETVLAEQSFSMEQRIDALYQAAFSRSPTADETQDAIDFLQHQSARYGSGSDDPRVWADLCHVLINVKEFVFVE